MTGLSTKNSQQVISAAMIYGKGSSDKLLTPYQISVNEAARKLALENPSLLDQRGILYEKAKEAVRGDSCFVFKKGKVLFDANSIFLLNVHVYMKLENNASE